MISTVGMLFRRLTGLTLVVALMLVPAVGRAVRRIDPTNAKPRLSAPYRSVDVRPAPILIAPDTSAVVRADTERDAAKQHIELADATTLPAAPDVSDRGTLRGPPLGQLLRSFDSRQPFDPSVTARRRGADPGVFMPRLRGEFVDAFRRLDTCRVSNAIETFDVRLRNEGFADSTIRALFDDLPPVVGHAVTARIHGSTPPPVGHTYDDRTDWWNYILTVPAPRVVVVEDADDRPGIGAFVGEVHANILKALDCAGYVTNGSVRDLRGVHALGFQVFAPHVAVSHAYVHVIEFGRPVTVGGLAVSSGDIVFGDRHGLLNLPEDIVERIPAAAERMAIAERDVIALCQSPDFSIERLRQLVRDLG